MHFTKQNRSWLTFDTWKIGESLVPINFYMLTFLLEMETYFLLYSGTKMAQAGEFLPAWWKACKNPFYSIPCITCCWWPGSLCHLLGITRHGIKLPVFIAEYSGFSNKRVKHGWTLWCLNRNTLGGRSVYFCWCQLLTESSLTHLGLGMPYGDTDLGEHWVR